MPVYQYACTECGHQLEARQGFHDDPLTDCPACAGRLRKVLSAVGVVFKGSGFYRTDSRKDARTPAGAAANGSTSEASDASGKGSDQGSGASKSGTSSTSSTSGESTASGSSAGGGSGSRGGSNASTPAGAAAS